MKKVTKLTESNLIYPILCILLAAGLNLLQPSVIKGENGHKLWLRYKLISNPELLQAYRAKIQGVLLSTRSETMKAVRNELKIGLEGLLDRKVNFIRSVDQKGVLVVGTPSNSPVIASLDLTDQLEQVGKEGYIIKNIEINGNKSIIVAANTDIGVLYGTFGFLRLLQTHQPLTDLDIISAPKVENRILDHWANLNSTVERGYAGLSIWNWANLPQYKSPRYTIYARANASIGINGTVLNNVNADQRILTEKFLKKAAALADIFRPYGIQVYLSIPFDAPVTLGNLDTYDPLNKKVQKWWKKKVNQIYRMIPDFGGFLLKANSEGQPGPQVYERTYAQGANMLARALKPHGGILMLRTFVYDEHSKEDRARQAYEAFVPLDGKFASNVILQVKNGPIDFQPREPFHPLFGALPNTQTMLELQITQEYLGHTHWLVYLAPLYKEALEADTYARGKGSTVAKVIDGSLFGYDKTAIAGVANTGNAINWTGHPFGQANWYAFGRLAWNHGLSSAEIAEEWTRMTFTNDPVFVKKVKKMMLASRQIAVLYTMPLGLTHLFSQPKHWAPAPWHDEGPLEWRSTYYHRADSMGIGFDRTASGSNQIEQYFPPVTKKFANIKTTPEKYLLWFHHVSWDYEMESGRTLWEELVYKYYQGVDSVQWMQNIWASLAGKIDHQRYHHVKALLELQYIEAVWWRNACLLYFQTFSQQPIPEKYPQPNHTLEYYKNNVVRLPPQY